MTRLEFEGVTGPIAFDEVGDRTSGTFEIWEVVKDAATETGYKNARIKVVSK